MFAMLVNLCLAVWPFNNAVKIDGLESHIKRANADPWHLYAIRQRHRRPHVCLACAWLAKSLARHALIFETGCGSGINLLWLGKKGFRNLHGADLSPEAVSLGRSLAGKAGIPVEIWQDDSLAPQRIPQGIEGLIALNWLYHLPGATLDDFFSIYRDRLAPGAKVAFDMVDISYNRRKGNEYHTHDLHLPVSVRRSTEYPLRLSQKEVICIAERHSFTVMRCAKVGGTVPRTVWLVGSE